MDLGKKRRREGTNAPTVHTQSSHAVPNGRGPIGRSAIPIVELEGGITEHWNGSRRAATMGPILNACRVRLLFLWSDAWLVRFLQLFYRWGRRIMGKVRRCTESRRAHLLQFNGIELRFLSLLGWYASKCSVTCAPNWSYYTCEMHCIQLMHLNLETFASHLANAC